MIEKRHDVLQRVSLVDEQKCTSNKYSSGKKAEESYHLRYTLTIHDCYKYGIQHHHTVVFSHFGSEYNQGMLQ